MHYLKYFLLILIVIAIAGVFLGPALYSQLFAPTASTVPEQTFDTPPTINTVATNLSVPWDVAALPGGDLLVSERTGDLLRLRSDGTPERLTVPKVSSRGEGGLMGLVLHPDFANNQWLYLYRTVEVAGERQNEVVRFVYDDAHTLRDETVILSGIPGATYHDGGALSFGPDGYLYLTTGDAGEPELAQDTESIAGKILRVTDTGEPAPDNPFDSLVYSYGHRNAQGLAWDSQGQLWSTEHGRSGVQSGLDELNRIEAGGNYGWPDSQGDTVEEGTIAPVLHSGANETWAPASLASAGNTLYFAGLRGQRLYQVTNITESPTITAFFPEEYGRLRATRIIDDVLYLTTSNTDGRGNADAEDDILLSIPLSVLPE